MARGLKRRDDGEENVIVGSPTLLGGQVDRGAKRAGGGSEEE